MRVRSRAGDNRHGADARAGFVLVEVAAALAVLGLVITFVYPSLSLQRTTSARFRGIVTSAVALLRDARTAALTGGAPVAVTFDGARRTLAAGPRALTAPPDVDVTLTAGGNCPAAAGRAQILFRPDGTTCGGVFRFAGGGRIVVARVGWINGRIDVAAGS